MSWRASHCCLSTCVISALPREEITRHWLELQKAFQCTICYLALMAGVNKQTNQEMLALLQASWPFVTVTGMGGNGSVTVKDGKIFKVPGIPDRNAFTADSLHVLHSWQWQTQLGAPGCSCLLWSKACLDGKNNFLRYLLLEAEFTLLSLTSAEIRNASLTASWWVLGSRAKSHWFGIL